MLGSADWAGGPEEGSRSRGRFRGFGGAGASAGRMAARKNVPGRRRCSRWKGC